MSDERSTPEAGWSEENSQAFINWGRYFVPERERQIRIITDLIPEREETIQMWELSCGEGLLAEAVLERFPSARLVGFDRSATMLEQATGRLRRFGGRFQSRQFDLADRGWRTTETPLHAIVSSLAIHHLDDAQKRQLFEDLFPLLAEGGVLLIADLVQPAHPLGRDLAAHEWDEAVRERALALDGHTDALSRFEEQEWNLYRYPDPDDIDHPSRLLDQLQWLSVAGFSDVDVYWMRAGHAIFGGYKGA